MDEDSGKKYLLIDVPRHKSALDEDVGSSFLRLGTPDPDPPMKDLLVEMMTDGFIDDDRDRGPNDTAAHATIEGAGGPAGMGHSLSKAARVAETERMLSKGGWHDHTDGNRISTTMGDKFELIRGNYKMAVLGRQDELKHAGGWDISGGHVVEGGITPNSILNIEWVQTWDGTWKVTELMEKGDTREIVHGNSVSENYGDIITSIIGAESEVDIPESQLAPKTKKKNPDITETTFAKTITSKTGSSATKVDAIKEETWATAIEEKTTASNITSRTEGAVTVKEYVGKSDQYATEVFSETFATTVQEKMTAGSMSSTTKAGAMSDIEVSGAKSSIIISGAMSDIELSALRLEVKAGLAFLEIEAGVLYTEICLGIKTEIKLAKETKFAMDTYRAEMKKSVLNAQGQEINIVRKFLSAAWTATSFKAAIGIEPP